MKKVFFTLLALALVLGMTLPMATPVSASGPVSWFHEDTVTQGNWYPTATGSPIGVYGSYAYILPNPPTNTTEVPIGNFSVPVGGSSGLPDSPYNWTSSQITGLNTYGLKNVSPYYDEYKGAKDGGYPPVTYTVSGTKIENNDPRVLTDSTGTDRKAACYFGVNPFTITLDLNAGTHQLELYLLDYDSNSRVETTLVTADSASVNSSFTGPFDQGVYEKFFIYVPSAQSVTITITNTSGANGVVSGIFLDTTTQNPVDTGVAEVDYLGTDLTTQGNWVGTYGALGYVLCGWNTASVKTAYNWSADMDESGGSLVGNYSTTAKVYAWTGLMPEYIQYPVFEWGWNSMHSPPQGSDPREVYYPQANGWRLACWDDGGERGQPTNGYEDFHLNFPEGTFLLSLYAYDYEGTPRQSETYQIYNATGTNLLASKQISGTAFDNGVYETFKVVAPAGGMNIILRVYNDAGYPTNENVLLSGIFVDKIEQVCGLTIGFWKTNAAKDLSLQKGNAQVDKSTYEGFLGSIDSNYGGSIDDWTSWHISDSALGLENALHWLSYGAYDVGSGYTSPEASNPQVKAQAQLLALMLTASYKGSNYQNAFYSGIPGYSGLNQVKNILSDLINDYNAGKYDTVYTIANYLNNNCGFYIDP